MQRVRIKTYTVTITAVLLYFLVSGGFLNNAQGANGIKMFANDKTEKIFYTHAYQKDGAWFSDLYAMNPDGTEPTQVTDFYPANASEATISKDGKSLYFTSNLLSLPDLTCQVDLLSNASSGLIHVYIVK